MTRQKQPSGKQLIGLLREDELLRFARLVTRCWSPRVRQTGKSPFDRAVLERASGAIQLVRGTLPAAGEHDGDDHRDRDMPHIY